jgi:hypothetical protein
MDRLCQFHLSRSSHLFPLHAEDGCQAADAVQNHSPVRGFSLESITIEMVAELEGGQRDVSLSQVWRAPRDRLCQFLLTTSQFTMGRCSALLWVAEAEVRVVEASDR